MQRSLFSVTPQMPINEAIRVLLKHKISGAPVLENESLVGMFSELDCLRVLASGEFYAADHSEEGIVADYMTRDFKWVEPGRDLYSLAQYFLTHAVRRLPVIENGNLLGQLSRRDVLRAMDQLGEKRMTQRRYPDYRGPSAEVGARRVS